MKHVRPWVLGDGTARAILKRRDHIVAHLEKLAQERGEAVVFPFWVKSDDRTATAGRGLRAARCPIGYRARRRGAGRDDPCGVPDAPRVVAVGDVHGAYDSLVTILRDAGLGTRRTDGQAERPTSCRRATCSTGGRTGARCSTS